MASLLTTPSYGKAIAIRRSAPRRTGSFPGVKTLVANMLSVLKTQKRAHLGSSSYNETSFFTGAKNMVFNGTINVNINNEISGVVLMDAAGKEYQLPIELAGSYENFVKVLGLLLSGHGIEAQIQRRFMAAGQYNLCIDKGPLISPITGEDNWFVVEPGRKVVMSVILPRLQSDSDSSFQCPRCKYWNPTDNLACNVSVVCIGCYGRIQLSEASSDLQNDELGDMSPDNNLKMLRNFHLKRYLAPTLSPLPVHEISPQSQKSIDLLVATVPTMVDINHGSIHIPATPSGLDTLNETARLLTSPYFHNTPSYDFLTPPMLGLYDDDEDFLSCHFYADNYFDNGDDDSSVLSSSPLTTNALLLPLDVECSSYPDISLSSPTFYSSDNTNVFSPPVANRNPRQSFDRYKRTQKRRVNRLLRKARRCFYHEKRIRTFKHIKIRRKRRVLKLNNAH
ncbi:hypothetical protein CPB83DRAFT_908844 [Crepidotus variabilis]|uniref:Ubiquitin-like domain-containing protein n=1 Tax=Crepidotus variabilis TaxID=179855 RepID=A0A9P6JMN4_9AGAR|nr:hypothetical protein CPB83DRAFT_908844 [Crepidotus variabilis]